MWKKGWYKNSLTSEAFCCLATQGIIDWSTLNSFLIWKSDGFSNWLSTNLGFLDRNFFFNFNSPMFLFQVSTHTSYFEVIHIRNEFQESSSCFWSVRFSTLWLFSLLLRSTPVMSTATPTRNSSQMFNIKENVMFFLPNCRLFSHLWNGMLHPDNINTLQGSTNRGIRTAETSGNLKKSMEIT